MSAKVVVYSKANCQQCRMTMMALDKFKVMYSVKLIDEDENAYEFVKSLGYSQAPVVYVDADGVVSHWSAFRLKRIEGLAELTRKAQA